MPKDWWPRFKRGFYRNFLDFLKIFAAEDRFIHQHRNKSSMIAEQDRYGTIGKKKSKHQD